MPSIRSLVRFLLLLMAQKFWGEITIRFKDGELSGPVDTRATHHSTDLPQPVPGTEAAARVAEMEQDAFRST